MIDPDYRLCPVRAISCTHHAHCVRAQLKPHATRQAWLTPNRRGDECQYFSPIEAFLLPAEPLPVCTLNPGGPSTLAESENLGQSPTVNAPQGVPINGDGAAECREVSGESGSANALTTAGSDAANTEQRTNAEAGGVSFPEREARGGVSVREPSGVPSIPEGLTPEQQDRAIRLNALRITSGRQS